MSRMMKAMVVLSLFVALLFPSAHMALAATFQLSGTVTDQSSNPIANATVTVSLTAARDIYAIPP